MSGQFLYFTENSAYLRCRVRDVKSGAYADMTNWTCALDLYKKCLKTVSGAISVGEGLPFSIASFIIFKLPLLRICY